MFTYTRKCYWILDLRNMSDVEMFEKWRKRWEPQWQKISK